MKRIAITPIFIVLVLFILLFGWVAVDTLILHYDASASLGGGFAALFAIVGILILVLEQAVVYYINPKRKSIWIVEGLLIVVLIVVLRVTDFEFSIG